MSEKANLADLKKGICRLEELFREAPIPRLGDDSLLEQRQHALVGRRLCQQRDGKLSSHSSVPLQVRLPRWSYLLVLQVQESDSWVAVKELELSYSLGETLLFTIYTHYGYLV